MNSYSDQLQYLVSRDFNPNKSRMKPPYSVIKIVSSNEYTIVTFPCYEDIYNN